MTPKGGCGSKRRACLGCHKNRKKCEYEAETGACTRCARLGKPCVDRRGTVDGEELACTMLGIGSRGAMPPCQSCSRDRKKCEREFGSTCCKRCERLDKPCVPRGEQNQASPPCTPTAFDPACSSAPPSPKHAPVNEAWTEIVHTHPISLLACQPREHTAILGTAHALVATGTAMGITTTPPFVNWLCRSLSTTAAGSNNLNAMHAAATLALLAGVAPCNLVPDNFDSAVSPDELAACQAAAAAEFAFGEDAAFLIEQNIAGKRSVQTNTTFGGLFPPAGEAGAGAPAFLGAWLPRTKIAPASLKALLDRLLQSALCATVTGSPARLSFRATEEVSVVDKGGNLVAAIVSLNAIVFLGGKVSIFVASFRPVKAARAVSHTRADIMRGCREDKHKMDVEIELGLSPSSDLSFFCDDSAAWFALE